MAGQAFWIASAQRMIRRSLSNLTPDDDTDELVLELAGVIVEEHQFPPLLCTKLQEFTNKNNQ